MASQEKKPIGAIIVLFAGLDNAGKTSIILALSRDFSKASKVKPTRGIKRKEYNLLGMVISQWDLGGQALYRRNYLKVQAEMVFNRTESVIFVLDIQDKDRSEEAITYLSDIITQLKNLNLEPTIHVFFHKFDPEISISGLKAELINISLELRNKIKTIDYTKFEFYRTSIYNLQTLIIAVSKILLSKNPKSIVLDSTINEFSNK